MVRRKNRVARGEFADFVAVRQRVFGEQTRAHCGRHRNARLRQGARGDERDLLAQTGALSSGQIFDEGERIQLAKEQHFGADVVADARANALV